MLLITSSNANSQEISPVSVQTVLKLAGANNLTIKEYQAMYRQALADQVKAGEWWLPVLRAGITTHYLNGAAMNTNARIINGLNQNSLFSAFGFSAEIDFNKGRYEYLAAKQMSVAASYASIAAHNQAILHAVQTYYDLQADQLSYLFLTRLASQADTLAGQLKIQVDAGLRYQSEYLLAASNAQHYYIEAIQQKENWQKAGITLSSLLNLIGNIRLVSADSVMLPLRNDFMSDSTATNNFNVRPEYKSLQAELSSYQTTRKISTNGYALPKIIIGTDDGLFGAYSYPLYNTYQINASIVWTLPLGRLFKHGELQRQDARIAIQQNKIEQFKNQYFIEIQNADIQKHSAYQQLQAATSALNMAGNALLQSQQRQQLGTAKAFEVIQAEQVYLQIKLDDIKAIAEYNKAIYSIFVAKGGTL
ncbi:MULTISPECIES: TolC family protein [unclassified Mucilaginibacter]|uniref:TolC family protein n=1 Tax=unclassified Mucilaginibacter TaxID=2617802 RepID=UPI002B225E44|nr:MULTISPECIES: TolC family protein [unclassified Mucilaginibacter]MEB0262799.1 TolC family protein [Mucilaginibacter sp. 10I4]